MSVYTGTREYTSLTIMNLSQIRDAERAQREILEKGVRVPDYSKLAAALGVVATILGLIFLRKSSLGLAAGVTSLVAGMSASEKQAVESLLVDGLLYLGQLEDFMVDNPTIDMIEVRLPFLEYTYLDSSENWRFVSGTGAITRVHTPGGWLEA